MAVLHKREPTQRPALVRSDRRFGNQPFIAELESRAQPCLFRLRQNRASSPKNEPREQIEPLMPDKDVQAWKYPVPVTNSA